MEKIIKIALSILLLLCLLDLPYGFFQFVRFISLIFFSFLAYNSNQKGQQIEMIVFIALALLFQPIFKISLGRTIWNMVDFFVAVGLILSILLGSRRYLK